MNPAATALDARHPIWAGRLPANPADLWVFVAALTGEDLMDLFAHCTAMSLDATKYLHASRIKGGDALDAIAAGIELNMADYWKPTLSNFFGRVTRSQILESWARRSARTHHGA
jgi:ParB family chromosome partitioning protein